MMGRGEAPPSYDVIEESLYDDDDDDVVDPRLRYDHHHGES
jgi:hypothetical protein